MWKSKNVGFGMGVELVKIKARLSLPATPTKAQLRICYVGEDYHMYLPNVSSRSTSTYNADNVPVTIYNNIDKDFCNNYNNYNKNACERACIDPNTIYKDTNIDPNISPNMQSNIDNIDTNRLYNSPNKDINNIHKDIYKGSSACTHTRVYDINRGKTKAEIFGDRYCSRKEPGKEFNLENFVLYCREYIYTGALLHPRNPKAKSFNYEAMSFYNNKEFDIDKVRKSFGSIGFNGEIGICPAGEYTYIYVISDSMWLSYYTNKLPSKHTKRNIGMCEVWADYNRKYIIRKLLRFFNITMYTSLTNIWTGIDVFGNKLNFDYHTGLGKVCIVNTDKEILLYSGKGKDVLCKAEELNENAKLEGVLPKLFTYNYNNNIQYEYDNKVKHYQPKEVRQKKTRQEILLENKEKGKDKPKKQPKGKDAPSLKKNPRHDKYHYVPVRNNPYHLTSIQLKHRRERLKAYWDKVNGVNQAEEK